MPYHILVIPAIMFKFFLQELKEAVKLVLMCLATL